MLNVLLYLFSVHFKYGVQLCIVIKLPFSNIILFLASPEVNFAWYFHCFPIPFPYMYFPIFGYCFELSITQTFFDFPGRLQLSGIDSTFNYYKKS